MLAVMGIPATRIVIDVRRTSDNRLVGVVRTAGGGEVGRFSGWVELLGVLEAAGPPAIHPSAQPSQPPSIPSSHATEP